MNGPERPSRRQPVAGMKSFSGLDRNCLRASAAASSSRSAAPGWRRAPGRNGTVSEAYGAAITGERDAAGGLPLDAGDPHPAMPAIPMTMASAPGRSLTPAVTRRLALAWRRGVPGGAGHLRLEAAPRPAERRASVAERNRRHRDDPEAGIRPLCGILRDRREEVSRDDLLAGVLGLEDHDELVLARQEILVVNRTSPS